MSTRRSVLAAAACVACAGAGAAALAAGVETRTRTTTVPSFEKSRVAARCRAASGLAAGGFSAQTRRRYGLVLNRFRPLGLRGFSAGATNTYVNPAELTVDAYCGPARELQLVSQSTDIAGAGKAHESGGAIAMPCPAGTTIRLGGFEAQVSPQPSGPAVVVDELARPSPRVLSVSATNVGPAKGSLTAVALCGAGPPLAAARKTLKLPASGGRTAVTARCPKGTRVAFGGFDATSDDGNGPYISQLRLVDPHRWRAGAFQFARPGAKLTALAYCG